MILPIVASLAAKAYDAYKDKVNTSSTVAKSTPSTSNVVKPVTTSSATSSTPTVADHQAYINQSNPGGMDAYTKLQQDRYNQALSSNDLDLLKRLQADSVTRGYDLSQPQKIQELPLNNPYEQYMAEMQQKYDSLNSQIANSNQLAVNQGVDRLNSQRSNINQGFDENARQAYVSSMQAKNALPQQLASQGINGGATETSMLGLNTNYENNLNSINTNRQNSLLDIDNSIIDLKNSGSLNTAQQTLQNNQAALSAYQNMLNSSAGYNQWLTEYNSNRDDTEYNQNYQSGRDQVNDNNYNNEIANSNKQTEYNNILNRLSMGLISADDAVALGVPANDVQAYVDRIKAAQSAELANTIASTNKINSSGSKSPTETSPVTTADKYLSQGNRTKAIETLSSIYTNNEIKQYLESNGYRTDDIDWGKEDISSRYENPLISTGNVISYYKSKGYTNEQIASLLNK